MGATKSDSGNSSFRQQRGLYHYVPDRGTQTDPGPVSKHPSTGSLGNTDERFRRQNSVSAENTPSVTDPRSIASLPFRNQDSASTGSENILHRASNPVPNGETELVSTRAIGGRRSPVTIRGGRSLTEGPAHLRYAMFGSHAFLNDGTRAIRSAFPRAKSALTSGTLSALPFDRCSFYSMRDSMSSSSWL